MLNLIAALRKSCLQENWYAALYMALSLPDICAKLLEPGSSNAGRRYQAWFDKYLKPHYAGGADGHQFLTSADCWALRCSLLHEGSSEISSQRSRDVLSRVIFTTQAIHLMHLNDVLVLNVSAFCEVMIAGVESWMEDFRSDEAVQDRIRGMARVETGTFRPIPGVRVGSPY